MQEQVNNGVEEENSVGNAPGQEQDTQNEEPLLAEHKDEAVSREAKLEERISEAEDKYLRLYSEFENFRRRTAKERIEMITSANADLLRTLLPVVDDLERAVRSFDETNNLEALAEGLKLVQAKMTKTLEGKGVKPFSSKGEPFTPDMHEAITQIPAPDDSQKGKVIDEIEKGYMLHEKVLRFAKVVIGA
jgi:molecular chaperone GrpE